MFDNELLLEVDPQGVALMAELMYGVDETPIYIPDDLLAHVKLVVATKLRRNESFLMSWRHADGSGRSSIWLQPSIPLRFVFDGDVEPAIDHALLAALAESASSNGGLLLDIHDSSEGSHSASPAEPVADSRRRLATAAA